MADQNKRNRSVSDVAPPHRPVIRSSLSSSPHYSPQFTRRHVFNTTSSIAASTQRDTASLIAPQTYRTAHTAITSSTTASLIPAAPPAEPKSAPRIASSGEYPSMVQFCPSQHDIYACINCLPPTDGLGQRQIWNDPPPPAAASSSPRLRKPGPVLLELRKLQLVTDMAERQRGRLFESSIVAVSRGNPQLGRDIASTCLSFQPYADSDNIHSRTVNACATGLTTGALCVHQFTKADESDVYLSSSGIFASRHHRPATAVAWRPEEAGNSSHVAIGLAGIGSIAVGGGSSGGGRRGTASRATGGGDREFGCLLWDVEAQSHSKELSTKGTAVAPLAKLSHGSGVASLAWLQEGQTLAVGCQQRYVQLYDLRMAGSTSLASSIWAHRESVNGVEMDPHRSNIFATFSRTPGEPVKLWDARRMESSLTEIKLNTSHEIDMTSSPCAYAVQWSRLSPGMFSIAVGNTVQVYDTMTTSARPVLSHLNYVMGGLNVQDMALHPMRHTHVHASADGENGQSPETLLTELYQHRMLAVLSDRSVYDLPKFMNAPLVVSWRDGSLAHCLGRTIWMDPSPDSSLSMDISELHEGEDISATMMRRAHCLHHSRYSMDPLTNIQMLKEEQIVRESRFCVLGEDVGSATCESLIQLWTWINRVDVLCGDNEEPAHFHDIRAWPANSIIDSGAWTLLQLEETAPDGEASDSNSYSETLFSNMFDSPARRATLASCGWTFEQVGLPDILLGCEAQGDFERAAALALWHDDLGGAIDALHRGAESESTKKSYAETLRLVSMCLAGYRGANAESPASKVWRRECLSLLQRPDLTGERKNLSCVAYLRAMCLFLMNNGEERGLDVVLNDEWLSLCDRVAFACRFLDKRGLVNFLHERIQICRDSGNIEGLIITGLEKQGFKILSAYVDKYSDIQSAALVSGRVTIPQEWKAERAMASEWIDCYRSLLNTWQMWQSRAMFDVDRAERLRKRLGKPTGNHNQTTPVQVAAPAQLEARCNYCSMPLSGIRRQEAGTANQWLSKLSKMNPVLSCCPRCRKPLPRCSICLLSLGCLNPYTELTKERNTNLPFAEWFTWCMSCKHGGHAHHLVGWFANHEICPVSGCTCRCQFDGIKKINHSSRALVESSGYHQSVESTGA